MRKDTLNRMFRKPTPITVPRNNNAASSPPFKAEALWIVWLLTKEDYFPRGAQKIIIYNDAENMNTMKSDMNNVKNPRLSKC